MDYFFIKKNMEWDRFSMGGLFYLFNQIFLLLFCLFFFPLNQKRWVYGELMTQWCGGI